MSWLFLLAYACSGLAGLVYEVSWTRLLTLYIGHTTAAASAVVAAFLGGLAGGAGLGGTIAARFTPRRSLQIYIALELVVVLVALLLPSELRALIPLLAAAYRDGDPSVLFPLLRLVVCFGLVFLPALALGATFPMAIRWFTRNAADSAGASGALYALNTAGAAVGALLAGFTLIPAIGVSGTTRVGMAGSLFAAFCAWLALRSSAHETDDAAARPSPRPAEVTKRRPKNQPRDRVATSAAATEAVDRRWLAALVLGVSGFASLIHEIAWTRLLSMMLGPTIYAFAATLAAVIMGVAVGSAFGTWMERRSKSPAAWLAGALAGAALTSSATLVLAGGWLPAFIATEMARSPDVFDHLFQQGMLITAALVMPTAACLGAAFPLALGIAGRQSADAPRRFGAVYAINTIGAVSGSLVSGFVLIPVLGLRRTLIVVSGCLAIATALVVLRAAMSMPARAVTGLVTAVALALAVFGPPWDLNLLASGAYLYAPYIPKDLDLVTQLKAGTLLYYRDGAPATVSVKRLTGTTTLAVDGKVDASNRSDMLTQKLIAHLPLLLHEQPREVGIVGLGSGVTVGAALTHPVTRVDVAEISPEVVEASRLFAEENRHAVEDPRTHLVVADGRSHLLLGTRAYDVLISEPSNPWIAGVASLFTREFFETAKARLAPGGIICQWAHTYNIADRDLRSIVATFRSVFPNGTLWLVGQDDLLLIASAEPIDTRLAGIAAHWSRPGVAADLASVGAVEPFSLLSLYAGGPAELARYSEGAALLEDDRMTLEFSGPRQIHRAGTGGDNDAALSTLLPKDQGPEVVRQARARAGVGEWRRRAVMMTQADSHSVAYDDEVRALTIAPDDAPALELFVNTAVLSSRADDALSWVRGLTMNRPPTPQALAAMSKLLAARRLTANALETALEATRLVPPSPIAFEQLASLAADAADRGQLEGAVTTLRQIAPDRPGTLYYTAVSAFLAGREEEAIALAERVVRLDPAYAAVYDLLGAAYTKRAKPAEARNAFETSIRLNPHDSSAYTNLGLIELALGNRARAAGFFVEALALAPSSDVARRGLAEAQSAQRGPAEVAAK